MGKYNIRITEDDVSAFKRNGDLAVAFGSGMTQFTAPSIQLGAPDVGRIFAGNQQMNPLSDKIPSTIVSPQSTWQQVLPGISIAMGMISAVLALAEDIDSDLKEGEILGRPIRRQSYQIVNFQEFLPEDLTMDSV